MSIDLIALVRVYAEAIQNGRTLADIHHHLGLEMKELDEAMLEDSGPDGIVGEAMDIVTCALDLIVMHPSKLTDAQIMAVAVRKLDKWQLHYSNSIERDRSGD